MQSERELLKNAAVFAIIRVSTQFENIESFIRYPLRASPLFITWHFLVF